MSKIISKNLQKIKELSQKLITINETIESHINILNEIRKEYNIFTIKTIKDKPINNDLTIYSYSNVLISFNINNEESEFSFLEDQLTNLDKLNLSNFNTDINFILDLIQNKIQFQKIKRDLYLSLSLYKQIKKNYEKIEIENSNFYINSKIITSHFKNLIKKQCIEKDENQQYAYIKLKVEKSAELISFSYIKYPTPNTIQIKLPNLKDIEKIQIKNNTINSKTDYELIFKQEFFSLNKQIFSELNISIDSFLFYVTSSTDTYYTNYYNFSFSYILSIYSIEGDYMKILSDKIKLEEQIVNF